MGAITFKHKGSFKNLERFFERQEKKDLQRILRSYGQRGVSALASATPEDTGLTARSWGYEIKATRASLRIIFTNSNATNNNVPIVILIQYGHGTQSGSFVQGRDFINPSIRPVFDQIAEDLWKETTG